MKILFFLGHPAHFHLFRFVIKELKSKDHQVVIVIKSKDVLENLLATENLGYLNIYSKERSNNKFRIALSLLQRDLKLKNIVKNEKPDLMAGTSSEIARVGRFLRVPSVVVNEDDAEVVYNFARFSYPFTNVILVPVTCSTGKWKSKTVFYEGYHELAYLRPDYFNPEIEKVKDLINNPGEKYFILRLAKLTAHHDIGKKGIDKEIANRLISSLKGKGKIFITSERELEPEFEQYRIKIDPTLMHHALSFASLYIGDSQTMAAEAAVLGTPSIRFNDFVGRLGYLEELEHKYGLTYGIKTSEPELLFRKIDELLSIPNLKTEWQKRGEKMLSEKIDVTAFMVWFIENYPESVKVMKEYPEYQYRFK